MIYLHTGNHLGMTAHEVAAHLFELDHIVFALVTVAVGAWCYRAGRRAEARVRIRQEKQS